MSNNNSLMALAVARDEAQVWTSGLEPGTKPEHLHAPSERGHHHHVRQAQHHHGHDTDHSNAAFYESIVRALNSAGEIVVVGHGTGKANAMLGFIQYLERHHPDVARRVVGAVDSDLTALSSDEVLALVREWFEEHREFF
jgi:hypothetical protein